MMAFYCNTVHCERLRARILSYLMLQMDAKRLKKAIGTITDLTDPHDRFVDLAR